MFLLCGLLVVCIQLLTVLFVLLLVVGCLQYRFRRLSFCTCMLLVVPLRLLCCVYEDHFCAIVVCWLVFLFPMISLCTIINGNEEAGLVSGQILDALGMQQYKIWVVEISDDFENVDDDDNPIDNNTNEVTQSNQI